MTLTLVFWQEYGMLQFLIKMADLFPFRRFIARINSFLFFSLRHVNRSAIQSVSRSSHLTVISN